MHFHHTEVSERTEKLAYMLPSAVEKGNPPWASLHLQKAHISYINTSQPPSPSHPPYTSSLPSLLHDAPHARVPKTQTDSDDPNAQAKLIPAGSLHTAPSQHEHQAARAAGACTRRYAHQRASRSWGSCISRTVDGLLRGGVLLVLSGRAERRLHDRGAEEEG